MEAKLSIANLSCFLILPKGTFSNGIDLGFNPQLKTYQLLNTDMCFYKNDLISSLTRIMVG